jgi:N-acyl-D-amino-acid deacylase
VISSCETLIRNVNLIDGTGAEAFWADVAVEHGKVKEIGNLSHFAAQMIYDGGGQTLAPGFIDVHTHDDTSVIETPEMLPKISQGVTTCIVGNCGISAAPMTREGTLPDPLNLLGGRELFRYPSFANYVAAIKHARPSVNVGALVGHTSLRCNWLDRLDREATAEEIDAMRFQLKEGLEFGALGLSTGLAYLSAFSASTDELLGVAEPLAEAGGVYASHIRSETEAIIEALGEAVSVGQLSRAPVVVSHLKCAGIANWGRAEEILQFVGEGARGQEVGWDCYPYAAGSSTLDLRQVDERVTIQITWSEPHPELAGHSLGEIARKWSVSHRAAAKRLQPAGAIYHSISEEDMQKILAHPGTMIGSDGLPHDPRPHPRLWGTFPRVLGRYCRDLKLFSLPEAIRKMTSLPAGRFRLDGRGSIHEGGWADFVLFDPELIADRATFLHPIQSSLGVLGVWVNGVLSYSDGKPTGQRAGRFLTRRRESLL